MDLHYATQSIAVGSAYPAGPVRPVSPAPPATREPDFFGPAYVRAESRAMQESYAVYNADATMGDSQKKREKGVDGKELSESDEALLQKLEARDAKVKSHEAAHVMAAGGQASSPTYTYQTGPDGKRYAIGGSVNISIMTTGDSEADARRAQKAYRAAMATGEPSTRDMQTAAKAQNMAAEATSAKGWTAEASGAGTWSAVA